MRITIVYNIVGKFDHAADFDHLREGPLATGLDATNAQLEAEGKSYRLKIEEKE